MDQELTEIKVEGGMEEQNQQQSNSTIRREFKHFDIIPANSIASDHHYFASPATLSSPSYQKKIMKEWRILEDNLPDSIYVRVYEKRIDLLRAVIIGPAGTPYHNGLFFFDIQYPSDYPNKPPTVCYRSLLNTWHGKYKNEKWIPSQSTMLQVLVSIQALVLNAKPYFNEPAYAESPQSSDPWKTNSLLYNENAFILSCKTMLCILNTPPTFFEEFVVQHFRDRDDAILTACKAYDTGRARIGDQLTTNAATGIQNMPSRTFKTSMEEIYPKLVNSFAKNNGSPNGIMDTSSASDNRSPNGITNTSSASVLPSIIGKCILGVVLLLFLILIFIVFHNSILS
ncbi:hypothetical protein MKW98_017809 [Papaver atlanticum]|uniref:UBC core domain-containing protein n=1 Tax=Papaver atlanticum TaxID=357466 RepID=A0AAD4TEZ9_9MAGN|nr:hypothetical protein MKW98_017809 [Papaver atlanticum]